MAMGGLIKKDQRAFSLLEILAALGILAVIFLIFFRFGKSFDEQNSVTETRMRMEELVKSAKAYYLNHGDLPRMLEDEDFKIPLGAEGLNIDLKFQFDGWQNRMSYISYTNDDDNGRPGEILIDELYPNRPDVSPIAMVEIRENTRTLIRAIQFEGQRVAGLLISSGPDGIFNYPEPAAVPVEYGYSPVEYRSAPASDDIFMPIDLKPEATRIALADLKLLNEKVKAFDDRYLGINNNQEFEIAQNSPLQYDEGGCEGIRYVMNPDPFPGIPDPFTNCNQLNFPFTNPVYFPPPTRFPPSTLFDINCGRPTLDYMKANFCPLPGFGGCNFGYFEPEIRAIPAIPNPINPEVNCPGTPRAPQPADYARIPFVRGAPSADDCHWGLVETLFGDANNPDDNETNGDQARAFIFCLFNLNPNHIVDPWLNGYVWGCGSDETSDVRGGQRPGCEYTYASDDSRYHRFFSAGPNGLPFRLEIQLEIVEEDAQEDSDDIVP
jgi:prepilin-type N-terminal cleavage/methylation domain-containing protein